MLRSISIASTESRDALTTYTVETASGCIHKNVNMFAQIMIYCFTGGGGGGGGGGLMANVGIHHIDTKFLCMLFHV